MSSCMAHDAGGRDSSDDARNVPAAAWPWVEMGWIKRGVMGETMSAPDATVCDAIKIGLWTARADVGKQYGA